MATEPTTEDAGNEPLTGGSLPTIEGPHLSLDSPLFLRWLAEDAGLGDGATFTKAEGFTPAYVDGQAVARRFLDGLLDAIHGEVKFTTVDSSANTIILTGLGDIRRKLYWKKTAFGDNYAPGAYAHKPVFKFTDKFKKEIQNS